MQAENANVLVHLNDAMRQRQQTFYLPCSLDVHMHEIQKLCPQMGNASIQVDIGISCHLLSLLPYIMFAMLMRLVLDGVGLGFGTVFGGERISVASCTRFTGLCGGG